MKILLIEDDVEKLKTLQQFLRGEFAEAQVTVARSFASGLRAAIAGEDEIDVILLDMSMPNYDVSFSEPSGGTPEHFAGRDLLTQMRLRSIAIPTIVVTMFDSFGEKPNTISLGQLADQLRSEYAPPFRELVYYDSRREGWKKQLKESIVRVIGG
jgi:CheY-like chemotaxis protein